MISGTAKGRRLAAPAGSATRPTTDAVREAIFNSLQSIVDLEGANVVDLFAGSGALGIEALSRGAAFAAFVDTSRDAVLAIGDNLEATGFVGCEVVRNDVLRWLDSHRAVARPWDVAFADPPYEFDEWASLARLDARILVAESDREITLEPQWEILRAKRYGSTVVTIFRPREST